MSEYVLRTDEPIDCCAKCPMCHKQGSAWCQYLLKWIPTNEKKERREDCPLKELPPHGDLIDRSKLVLHGRVDDFGDLQEMNDYYDATEVINAPIILEASKEN